MAETIDLDLRKRLIKKQACFSQLNDSELDILAPILKEVFLKPNDVIVREGDSVDSVYLIVSGKADVRVIVDKDHPDQTKSVATLGPEEAIGLNERGFYSISGIRTATVVAITDMVLLRLSVAAFHGFALAYPHVTDVMRQYAAKWLGMHS